MSKPKWTDIAQEGDEPRMAVAYQRDSEGRLRVVAAGQGSAAEQIIEQAEQAGVPIGRDPERVRRLLQAEGEGSRIPPEVYELMSTVVTFAQELNETWILQHEES